MALANRSRDDTRCLQGDCPHFTVNLNSSVHAILSRQLKSSTPSKAVRPGDKLTAIATAAIQVNNKKGTVPLFPAAVFCPPFEHDQAIAAIEKEYDVRGWYLLLIKQTPHFDVLRSHPRFQALLQRMGFPG
jgi:hypothetical protein